MLDPKRYEPFIIFRCVIGSLAYGLEGEDSDTDRRGSWLSARLPNGNDTGCWWRASLLTGPRPACSGFRGAACP